MRNVLAALGIILTMANSNPIIVGGGISSGAPFTLNHLVYVTNATPPQLSSFAPTVVKDTGSNVVYMNVPNSAGVSVPTNQNALETLRIKGGLIVEGLGVDSVNIGRGATGVAAIADQIIIGRGATEVGGLAPTGAVCIGSVSNLSGGASVIVGRNSGSGSANPVGGVFIGDTAQASGNAGGANVVVIGDSALASLGNAGGGTSVVVGFSANASHPSSVVVGANANASLVSAAGQNTVVIGQSTTSSKGGTTVVGGAANATQTNATVIGAGSSATAAAAQQRSVVVGQGSSTTGNDSIVIGGGSALTNNAIAIGAGAVDLGAGVLQLGTNGTQITTTVIGSGNTIGGPPAQTIRFTNGTGADNAAGDITIQAALSTGAATPGRLLFNLGAAHGSDAVLQTPFTALALDASTTADDIRLLLWDVSAGALVRVSRGAAGSGGVGFRLLRVPN